MSETRERSGPGGAGEGESALELRANQLPMTTPLVDYVLGLGDDALVSAQRMGRWISRAPELEEDVALANIGLDLLGQARMLLSYAGELEGEGRDEDDLAYLRDDRDFRNVWLVERPQEDFAVAMVRLLVLATYQHALYNAMRGSTDDRLAAIAGKAVKEVAYHLDHASAWVVRLGDGTEESHRRIRAALAAEWPHVEELFAPLKPEQAGLVDQGIAVDPVALRDRALLRVEAVLAEAALDVPQVTPAVGRGRRGLHTEHLGHLLAPMQHLTRSHPGARW